jgi:hypothetical protein
MGLSTEGFDILQAPDKAGTEKSSDDPIMRMLRNTLLNGKGKYGWIPHNAGFGFLDIARATLGQIHF